MFVKSVEQKNQELEYFKFELNGEINVLSDLCQMINESKYYRVIERYYPITLSNEDKNNITKYLKENKYSVYIENDRGHTYVKVWWE